MKDRSLVFCFTLVGVFAVFGSVLFYRSSPESLAERTRVALATAGYGEMTAVFDGDGVYLLGEASSANALSQAVGVVSGVKGVSGVDVTHATVKRRLESPHMSLAFVGNHISARGRVAREETRAEILAELKRQYPDAEIEANRLVVRGDVEDFGGFGESPRTLRGIGAKEQEMGVVAAVGGDVVWQVMASGAGIEEIRAGLGKVLPGTEVEETMDEFDDVLTTEHLRDEYVAVKEEVDGLEAAREAAEDKAKGLEVALAEMRVAFVEATGRAEAGELAHAMTKKELKETEKELGEVRAELMGKVGEVVKMEAEVAHLGEELLRKDAEVEAAAKAAEGRMAEVRAALEGAEAAAAAGAEEKETMEARHAAEVMAAERQIEAAKERHDAEVGKLRGEIGRLEAALEKSGAVAADGGEDGQLGEPGARAVPGSAAGAGTRQKKVEVARGAAARAAERAREAAESGVERANAMKKSLGTTNADPGSGATELAPSGKPTPHVPRSGIEKPDVVGGFAEKNAGSGR